MKLDFLVMRSFGKWLAKQIFEKKIHSCPNKERGTNNLVI